MSWSKDYTKVYMINRLDALETLICIIDIFQDVTPYSWRKIMFDTKKPVSPKKELILHVRPGWFFFWKTFLPTSCFHGLTPLGPVSPKQRSDAVCWNRPIYLWGSLFPHLFSCIDSLTFWTFLISRLPASLVITCPTTWNQTRNKKFCYWQSNQS